MANTIADFRVLYPEFTSTPDAQLSAHLVNAEARVHADFGDRREECVYLEMATALADSAGGRPARRTRGDVDPSVYAHRLHLLQLESSLGNRVS